MRDESARWRQIEELCHAALERDVAERDQFLRTACRDDDALRREVEALLAHEQTGERFLGSPLGAVAAEVMSQLATLPVGRRIGVYEVLSLLGAGGMGEVYRARDTRLRREVAIKILPRAFTEDPDRVARFDREARVLAALNHPHIATIYGIEEAGGVPALVMELVAGGTLAQRLAGGGLAIADALSIARQIAEALEAAHEKGIIHRDLKPANIALTKDGQVKVLDFGLAKAVEPTTGPFDAMDSPTSTSPAKMTGIGVILGTAAYMSPEQAKGRPADKRSDIWAFGCVLYEMLTGTRAFQGEEITDTLAFILTKDINWNSLPPSTPTAIRRLLRRCLEKNAQNRLHDIADARIEIDETLTKVADVIGETATGSPVEAEHAQRNRSPFHAGSFRMSHILIAAALTIVAVGAWLLRSRGDEAGIAGVRLTNPFQVTSALGLETYPNWSPDGLRLAYEASDDGYDNGPYHIWVAQLGGGEPVDLTRDYPGNNRRPSWSPDGRQIAYLSDQGGEWGLYIMAGIGGQPRKILALPGIGTGSISTPQWSADGATIFAAVDQAGENVVIGVSLQSLETTRVALPRHEGNLCWDLSLSPNGKRFAYVEAGGGGPDVSRLWTIPMSGGPAIPLTDGLTAVWSPLWSNDGRAVFYVSNRGGVWDLWQQAVVPDGRPVGGPVGITQGLGIRNVSFSRDGARMAYTRGGRVSNVWRVPLRSDRPATWADATQVTAEHAFIEFIDISPDGTQLAVSSDRHGHPALWLLPATGGAMTPLTTGPTPDWSPRWSPDGAQIAFYSYRTGNRDIWVMPSRGGPARQLTTDPGTDWYPLWSPDGREIAFRSTRPARLSIVASTGGQPQPLATGSFGAAEWSPDGLWFLVLRQGRFYRIPRSGGEPVPLPETIGRPAYARFSRDGRSIYYSAVTAGPKEQHDLWQLSLDGGSISRLTRLDGRRGRLYDDFAADDRYLYFTWSDGDGDIWVMDVVRGRP